MSLTKEDDVTLPATNPLIAGPTPDVTQVEIPADGHALKGHLAWPQGVTSGPAVLVIHAQRGLQPVIRDTADGLASSGYIAVAPDLLSSEGGTDSIAFEKLPDVLHGLSHERIDADTMAAIRWLKSMPEVTRIGILGFCFGGGVVWRAITNSPDIVAAVPCYGSNPPLEHVRTISAAVHGIYGELDERINAGVPAIRQALDEAKVTHVLKTYEGVRHNFMAHTSEGSYNAAAAAAAWADALAWLDKYLRP